jgi:hypothetical protein
MSTGTELQTREDTDLQPVDQRAELIGVPSIVRAEIDALITTAKSYPRSITKCLRDAQTLATMNPEVAARCLYALPRDGKTIEGPSVRLAEILAASWGNVRVTGRIVEENDRFVTAMGACVDLERNNGRQIEVRRRITDKRGRRYSDDMIVTTANAAISIATRNAILAVVPRALWDTVYQAARKTASGGMETIEEKRTKWLAYWASHGVEAHEVYEALGVKGRPDVGLEQIATMVGWQNAVEDEATTVESIFRPNVPAATPGTTKTATLTQALKDRKGKQPQAATPLLDHPKPAREPGQDDDIDDEAAKELKGRGL